MNKPADKDVQPTIYVVDDDDGMRRALDTLLSTVGYKTAVFSRPVNFCRNSSPRRTVVSFWISACRR